MVTKKQTNKPGYIVMLSLLIIAMAVALITAVVRETFVYQRQARAAHDRAKARLLALSSFELVLSQLSYIPSPKKESKEQQQEKYNKTEKKEEKPQDKKALWYGNILSVINHWQALEIPAGSEGIEGSISYYISCEHGKVNLDQLLQEEKQKKQEEDAAKEAESSQGKQQTPESAKANQNNPKNGEKGQRQGAGKQSEKNQFISFIDGLLKKEKEVSIKEVLKQFEEQFHRGPEDATELLRTQPFLRLKDALFVTRELSKKPLFAMDLFTTSEKAKKINPWVLSGSLKTLVGFKDNPEVKIDKEFLNNIKPQMNWAVDWDKTLAPLYGKKFDTLDKALVEQFATEFEAQAFFVVSYCKVGTITQKMGALIEVDERLTGHAP